MRIGTNFTVPFGGEEGSPSLATFPLVTKLLDPDPSVGVDIAMTRRDSLGGLVSCERPPNARRMLSLGQLRLLFPLA